MVAVAVGDTAIFEELIKNGADINAIAKVCCVWDVSRDKRNRFEDTKVFPVNTFRSKKTQVSQPLLEVTDFFRIFLTPAGDVPKPRDATWLPRTD